MGNQSATSNNIQIPQSRVTTYFEIFHQIKTPLMLLDGKHMSLIDLNNKCSSLFGIKRGELCLSRSASIHFWPSVQRLHQNQTSKHFLKKQFKKLKKTKNKTEFIFECLNQEGNTLWAHFSVTKINIWKNSMFQIIISPIPNPLKNLSFIYPKKKKNNLLD
ncbi:hypothetical protein M0812_08311 [Anaeramoeba flamelloides]|uniref:LOV domain-containing protein n=1 Tax=Anaeramoeba flamelloides TaxID=1746091 RepID=A0AAV7ZX26_9EUKA|nr:hypothetical protein M0812_08311 [Anaeramoeba flamelloides]|eukprot:Anaeramoba_flamelloidesa819557_17.p1 GENE.a819557_17~~a819557_17.p1  ORF type:complete len:161 (-),score=39.44 a819557_17:24-506(-)